MPCLAFILVQPSLLFTPYFCPRHVNDPMLTEVFNIVGLQLTSKLSRRQKESLRETYCLQCPVSYDERLYCRTGAEEDPADDVADLTDEGRLTSSDLRLLIQAEEEFSQTRGFSRLLPGTEHRKYLEYLERRHQGDNLLAAWEERYHNTRQEGRQVLARLCLQGLHLQ